MWVPYRIQKQSLKSSHWIDKIPVGKKGRDFPKEKWGKESGRFHFICFTFLHRRRCFKNNRRVDILFH